MAKIRSIRDIEALERAPLSSRQIPGSVYELLRESAAAYADSIALSMLPSGDPDEPSIDVTYRELFRSINQVARLYRELGVKRRDAVAVLLPNLAETCTTVFAAESVAIAAPINPGLGIETIGGLLRTSGARVLVAPGPALSPGIWDKAAALAERCPDLRAIVAVGGGGPDDRLGQVEVVPISRSEKLSGAPLEASGGDCGDAVAAYFHTGGTTAAPKLARSLHRSQTYMAWAICEVMDFRTGDVELEGLPLYHVNALIGGALALFRVGARVVLLGPNGFRHEGIIPGLWGLVERFQATLLSAVPTIYAALLGVPTGGRDVSSLRFGLCGAAPMSVEVFRRFEAMTGLAIVEGYGLTEGTLISCVNPPYGDRRIGAVGIRFPYQRVEVVPPGGQDGRCAPGEEGEVCLAGPNVFPGYVCEEHNASLWGPGGLLRTGDLGRIDDDGYLWLTGRAKDLIIRGGHNLDPAMIEEALHRRTDVRLAAAVGRPDAHAGEVPMVFVELRDGAATSADELLAFARETIPERAAVPVAVRVLPALPLTGVGKISKPPLRVLATQEAVDECLADMGPAAAGVRARAALGGGGVEVTLEPQGPHGEAAAREARQRLAPLSAVKLKSA